MAHTEKLVLAPGLSLPAREAATQKFAFIGRSGSGPSYGAEKLAGLSLEYAVQVIVVAWVGVW